MASREEILKKYGITPDEKEPAPSVSREEVLKKYGLSSDKDYEPSALETGIAALSPKNIPAGIYGAMQALEAPSGKRMEAFERGFDTGREALGASEKTNPKAAMTGKLVRGLLGGAIAGPSVAGMGALGAAEALGDTSANPARLSDASERERLGKDIGAGGALGLAGGVASEYVLPGVASSLKNTAGRLAEKATGATRTMAEKFEKGAGRELLDRGLVKFGYSPSNIAKATEKAMTSAESSLDDVLKNVDSSGGKMSVDDIISEIDKRISNLKEKGAGFIPQANKLEAIKEDIKASVGTKKFLNASELEAQKRSFKNVNWMDPEKAMAQKEAYRTFGGMTEKATGEINPSLLKEFKESKKVWGLLAPIREASEKRALQLNQSPVGGLLDIASVGAGYESDHKGAGLAFPIARRLLAPRAAASGAVTADQIANILQSLPPSARQAIVGGLISK